MRLLHRQEHLLHSTHRTESHSGIIQYNYNTDSPPPAGRYITEWINAAHLELFVQARPPSRLRDQQLVHVPVQLSRRHLRLSGQDGFHQGVVDKNILFLQTDSAEVKLTEKLHVG